MRELKKQPNRRLYIEALRRMTPEQKLLKVDELTETSRELLRAGIRVRYPDATEGERHVIYLERLERCRKRSC